MAHHHHHHAGHCHHDHHDGNDRNIGVAFGLNLAFAFIEAIGGIYTGSISILSDATHDFGDATALGLAWYLERVSKRGRDKHYSYGYKRFSLLSALIISIILILGSIVIISEAVQRVLEPRMPDAVGMLWLAILGAVVNGLAAWRMSRGHSLNDRAIRLHLMEDVLGWGAVLVVSIVMLFVEIPILDPLLSIAIACWILYNVYGTLRSTLRILLQGVPEGIATDQLEQDLSAVEGILGVHDLHLWTLNGEENIASLHIVIDSTHCHSPEAIAHIKSEVRHIALKHEVHHLTIEIDPEGQSCGMESC